LVSRQTYAQYEEAEARGTISLATLERAAAAMDCEFVYFVVPSASSGRSYAELARRRDPAAAHRRATDRTIELTGEGVPDAGG
jgi:transcriptional regulator with XRE-family HTH domain